MKFEMSFECCVCGECIRASKYSSTRKGEKARNCFELGLIRVAWLRKVQRSSVMKWKSFFFARNSLTAYQMTNRQHIQMPHNSWEYRNMLTHTELKQKSSKLGMNWRWRKNESNLYLHIFTACFMIYLILMLSDFRSNKNVCVWFWCCCSDETTKQSAALYSVKSAASLRKLKL